jgi:hypothetical protein
VYENELWQLVQSDNVIPIDFAIDILSKEDNNHDFLLTFLYTKREFSEMWTYLRLKVEKACARVKTESTISREVLLQERQFWIRKMVKQARKINCVAGEDVIIGQARWLFALDTTVAIECFKKNKGSS